MGKAAVVENRTTDLAAGDVTFVVTDPTNFKTLKMDRGEESLLKVMRQNYAEDGWEPVMEEGEEVWLSRKRRTATLTEIGTYTVAGAIAGTVTLWTQDIT